MSELGAGLGSSYPTTLDTDSSVEVNDGGATPTLARAECINDVNDAVVKIETELGVNPSGSYATVVARLNAVAAIQTVCTEYGTVATGSTVIPFDDSIPQNTEGDEYMTQAITPQSATSVLYIDVVIQLSSSVNNYICVALFQDTTANALASVVEFKDADAVAAIKFRHKMTSGTTSATTFKVRAGGNNAGTTTFNGVGGVRKYGGVLASSISVTEAGA